MHYESELVSTLMWPVRSSAAAQSHSCGVSSLHSGEESDSEEACTIYVQEHSPLSLYSGYRPKYLNTGMVFTFPNKTAVTFDMAWLGCMRSKHASHCLLWGRRIRMPRPTSYKEALLLCVLGRTCIMGTLLYEFRSNLVCHLHCSCRENSTVTRSRQL
jgi:hypothetical protein